MKADELTKKFINFFIRNGHKLLPNASLIPENDPSALFINSGMHPLIPYFLGESHPLGKRLVSLQRCLRTQDIDEVGDPTHLTFFEMLGNWSLGNYWKKQAVSWSWEFLTRELKLNSKRISVTCFAGDKNAPRDEETAEIWRSLGIPKEKIYFFGKKDNWWSVGEIGPCGPDTEMFYDTGKKKCSPKCQPGCNCGKYFEVWNDVFMEFNKLKSGKLEKLKQRNIDTGMGVERIMTILQGKDDVYQTELFWPIIKEIEEFSDKKYKENKMPMRIIADHLKAATFLIAEKIEPSNKDRGYILRRFLRRAAVKMYQLKGGLTPIPAFTAICHEVIRLYEGEYFEAKRIRNLVDKVIDQEMDKFSAALDRGLKKFKKATDEELVTVFAFDLFQTYGFPLEITEELFKQRGKNVDRKEFTQIYNKHQELSRKAAKKLFKGGLADISENVVKLHTVTHLLQQALRDVLGPHVKQAGSNITPQRLRFDFTHPKKLTNSQIKKIENIINQKIKEDLPVSVATVSLKKARQIGAIMLFDQKYPSLVKVYTIGDYSQEVCGGPHVSSTGMIGHVKITKQESSGTNTCRLYIVLQ
jgi:alanyl-tRNA synthetase